MRSLSKASSANTERFFPGLNNVCSSKRTALSTQTLYELMLIKLDATTQKTARRKTAQSASSQGAASRQATQQSDSPAAGPSTSSREQGHEDDASQSSHWYDPEDEFEETENHHGDSVLNTVVRDDSELDPSRIIGPEADRVIFDRFIDYNIVPELDDRHERDDGDHDEDSLTRSKRLLGVCK